MKDAFGREVQNLPDFPALETVIQGGAQGSGLPGSLELMGLIHSLELIRGHIFLNPGGAGKGTFNNGHDIYLDPNLLPPNATNAQLETAAIAIGHELGHVIDGQTHLQQATNAADAAQRGLNSEGFADRDEYITAKQLGAPMDDPNLQSIIAGIDQRDGGTSTDPNSQFSQDVVAAGANYAATDHPSSAPNLQYREYYEDQWALAHCAGAPASYDYHNTMPGDIKITTNADGTCTVVAPQIFMLDLTTDSQTSTGTISASGQVISAETDRYSGSTLVGTTTESLQSDGSEAITISGQTGPESGGYGANVSVNTGFGLTEFTGDGNTITNPFRSGFNLDVTGDNNSMTLNYDGTVIALGQGNTITLNDSAPSDAIREFGYLSAIVGGGDSTVNITHSLTWVRLSGMDQVVNGDGSEIDTEAGSATSATVNGNSDTIEEEGADLMTINGNNNKIDFSAAGTANISGTGETVTGSGDFLGIGDNSSLTITGTNNGITLGAADTVSLGDDSSASLTGNGATINATGSSDTVSADGSDNTITRSSGGTTTVSGSNNLLQLTGTGSTASIGGTGETVVGSSEILTFGDNSTGTVSGNSNDLTLGNSVALTLTGDEDTLNGSNDFLTLVDGIAVGVTGTGNSLSLGIDDTVTLGSGSAATLTGNSSTVDATSAADVTTVNGSGDTLAEVTGGTMTVNGSNDQLTVSGSAAAATLTGSGEVVSASGDTIALGSNSTATLSGNNDTISLGTSVAATLNGTGESLNGSDDFLTLGDGTTVTLTGSALNVTLGASNTVAVGADTSATITGNGATVTVTGSGDTTSVNGSDNAITAAGGTIIVNGSNDALTLSAAGGSATLTGSGETVNAGGDNITLGNNSTGTISGNNDTLVLGSSVAAALSGTGEAVSATDDVVDIGDNGAATVAGADNSITTGSSANITLNGNDNSVTLGSAATATLSGTGNHAISAGNTLTLSTSSQATVAGPSNQVNLGTSDKIFVNGSSDTIQVQSGDIVDLASNIAVTIIGSGATIVGNSGDTISLTGTGDSIYADSSFIQVNGTNTGDVVQGNGDTGGNWGGYRAASGAYGGYAGGGYYSATQAMAARRSFSARPASETQAGLADIAAIGAADHAASSARLPTGTFDVPDSGIFSMQSLMLAAGESASQSVLGSRATAPAAAAISSQGMADPLIHAMASWTSPPTAATSGHDPAISVPVQATSELLPTPRHLSGRHAAVLVQ